MKAEEKTERQPGKSAARKVIFIGGLVLCVLFGLMLICNLVIIIKGAINPDRPPSIFGVTPMVVKSDSMSGSGEGHIEEGDLVFVGPADPETLKEGDVIAFMDKDLFIIHRIVEARTDESGQRVFTTKGDANAEPDRKTVLADRLVGIYQGRIPMAGDFALFLQTPFGMLLFIGVPVLAFVSYDILRRQKSAARNKLRTAELEAELARLKEQEPSAPEKEQEKIQL